MAMSVAMHAKYPAALLGARVISKARRYSRQPLYTRLDWKG